MQAPDVKITFNNFRQLQNICLLPNKHLIVEGGGIFEGNFEVYQLEAEAGDMTEPI